MFKRNFQMSFTIAILYRFKQFVIDVMMCPRATKGTDDYKVNRDS